MLMGLRERHGDQRGFSLVELLVAMVLLGIVGGIVTQSIVSGLNASRRAQERVYALNDLTKGLERIGRELRIADPLDLSHITNITDIDSTIATFVHRDGKVFRYQYYLVTNDDGSSELREDVAVFALDGVPLALENRNSLFIVDSANTSTNIPLITYIDLAGQDMNCVGQADAAACRDHLATAEQVKIRLVRELPEQAPITAETVIGIRTARFNT
jgi:prepilin-type N-terminal cleavage/methylation domain-containing protein